MDKLEKKLHKMRIKDKACTICLNVWKGGRICNECIKSGKRKNWKNEQQ